MSDRSSYWLALAASFALLLCCLGGCRAPAAIATNDAIAPPPIGAVGDWEETPTKHARPEPPPRDDPAEIARNLHRAAMEQEMGRPGQARQYYQRILQAEPGHLVAHRRLAKIAGSQQDYPQAERHLRAVLRRRPASADLWTDLALCLKAQHRHLAADQALRSAIALNRQTARQIGPEIPGRRSEIAQHRTGPAATRRTASVAKYRSIAAHGSPSPGGLAPRRADESVRSVVSPLLPVAVVHHRQRAASGQTNPVQLASLGSLTNSGKVAPAQFKTDRRGTDGNLPVWNP